MTSASKTAIRKLAVNFSERDRPLFERELESNLPALEIREFDGIKVDSHGLLFKKNRIMVESFAFPENFDQWKFRSRVKASLRSLMSRRPRVIEYPVVWATDDWSSGYFHWMCDVLPRLYVVRDLWDVAQLLLPAGMRSLRFVGESLDIFGVKNVEYVDKGEVVYCSKVLYPNHTASSGDFNPTIIDAVRGRLRSRSSTSGSNVSERIYISRGNARKRRIINEEDVIRTVKEYGFEVVKAEDYSFREQISLFLSTKYLVSNHGAGLTNMLFADDRGRVLELRHKLDKINNCYFNMASALDLQYYYQLCEPHNAGDDPHIADLIVDIALLRSNVELMLRSQ